MVIKKILQVSEYSEDRQKAMLEVFGPDWKQILEKTMTKNVSVLSWLNQNFLSSAATRPLGSSPGGSGILSGEVLAITATGRCCTNLSASSSPTIRAATSRALPNSGVRFLRLWPSEASR